MLIQLIGCAGAGKDSFAGFIKELRPNIDLLKFAAPLKFAAEIVFGAGFDNRELKEVKVLYDRSRIDLAHKITEQLMGFEFKNQEFPYLMSPREYQQKIGLAIRNVNPDAFCDRLKDKEGIITDTRFENEVFIENVNLFLTYIHRPGHPKIHHPSEYLANTLNSLVELRKKSEGMYPTFIVYKGILIDVVVANTLDDLKLEAEEFVKGYAL